MMQMMQIVVFFVNGPFQENATKKLFWIFELFYEQNRTN